MFGGVEVWRGNVFGQNLKNEVGRRRRVGRSEVPQQGGPRGPRTQEFPSSSSHSRC